MALALAAAARARHRHLAARPARRAGRLRHARPPGPERCTSARRAICRSGCARTSGPRRRPPGRGCARGARQDRHGAHGLELEAALCELDLDPPLAYPENVRETSGRTGQSTCASRSPTRCETWPCARSCATTAPSAQGRSRHATARDRNGSGRCAAAISTHLPDACPSFLTAAACAVLRRRCLAPCRGAAAGARPFPLSLARLAWLAGDQAVLDAPLRERVARLIEQHRFEDAHGGGNAADRRAAGRRRPGGRHPPREPAHRVLLAADLDPRHVVAFAVVPGARRQAPTSARRATRASSSRRSRASSSGRRPRRLGRKPRAEGPRLPDGATRRPCCSPRPSRAARRAWCRWGARRPTRSRSSSASREPGAGCLCASRCRRGATRAPTSSQPWRSAILRRFPDGPGGRATRTVA